MTTHHTIFKFNPYRTAISIACGLGVMMALTTTAASAADNVLSKRLYLAEFNKHELVSSYKSAIIKNSDANAHANQKDALNENTQPYAETRFLEHVGSVELLFGITRFASTTGNSTAFVVGDGFGFADKNQPLLINSRLDPLDTKYDLSDDSDLESDIYSLGLGMFLKKGLMVGFKYDRTTSKIYKDLTQINTFKSDQYDFFTKYVHQLSNGKALNFEASFAIDTAIDNDRGDNQTINISGDYYVNQKNSIGIGIERITSEEDVLDGDVISIELRSFITPKFSVAAGMERYTSDNIQFEDDRTFDINFNARF